jgi:hypothetical protein
MSLFDTAEYKDYLVATQSERLSSTRRRTLRNEQTIARGYHPITNLPLAGRGTCGECKWALADKREYKKCGLNYPVHVTCGPATDLRLKWPACRAFEARTE